MSIKIEYGLNNSIETALENAQTLAALKSNDRIMGFLGAPANVEAYVGGVAVSTFADGDVVKLVTAGNTKGAVKVEYGLNNSIETAVDVVPNLESLKANDRIMGFLGAPANVEAYVGGVAVSTFADGDTVKLVTAGNTKGDN